MLSVVGAVLLEGSVAGAVLAWSVQTGFVKVGSLLDVKSHMVSQLTSILSWNNSIHFNSSMLLSLKEEKGVLGEQNTSHARKMYKNVELTDESTDNPSDGGDNQ